MNETAETGKEILISVSCGRCEAHRNELGILLSIKESIKNNFSDYNEDNQKDLIICWFNNHKLDERTEKIQQAKKETTAQIQKYKRENIRNINQ
jgi:hypothetical protein